MDSTFVNAHSRRNLDNRTGYSDPESRVGRIVKTRDLGYRLHLAVDARSELPVAMAAVSANENEKKHSIRLFEKASLHVKPRRLVADPQYNAQSLREVALKQGTLSIARSLSTFCFGVLLWFNYGILTNNLPVTIANFLTLVQAVIILMLKLKYK